MLSVTDPGSNAFLTPGLEINMDPDKHSGSYFRKICNNFQVKKSVADPQHIDADPDPALHTLMRIVSRSCFSL
jgi:hypothetical protein